MHQSQLDILGILHACADTCNNCFNADLSEEDIAMMARCIRTCRQCADMCSFAATSLSSGSDFTKGILALCAQICEACAEECNRHKHPHCQACAAQCGRCAAACRAYAGM